MPPSTVVRNTRISGQAILATVLAVLGTALVWRGVSRFAPPASRPVPSATPADGIGQARESAPTPTLEIDTAAMPQDDLRIKIESATLASASSVGVPGGVEQILADGAGEYLAAISKGAFESYIGFVESRGGRQNLDLNDPSQAARLRSFFDSVTSPYVGQAASLAQLIVRPRVMRGANVAQPAPPGFQVAGEVTSDTRFPQLQRVASMTDYGHVITADTYEVMLPVRHDLQGEQTTVWIGLWFTLAPEGGAWLPSRIVLYAPQGRAGSAGPLFSPPL